MKAVDEGISEKLEDISREEENHNKARIKRLTFHGGFDLGFANREQLHSKRSAREINEMKRDYHELFKVSQSLRVFCKELEMEPLFTKSDIIIRRNLILALKTVTGKHTSRMNTIMRELNYCIDMRLAHIEKYLQLEKEEDKVKRVGARRGATMAGCLDLSASNIFSNSQAMDNKLGFVGEGSNTQSSTNRPTFLNGGSRNTFASNLDIFKVTRSDADDSDYFEDSDNEMLVDMKHIIRHGKKMLISKSTSFEFNSVDLTIQTDQSPKASTTSKHKRARKGTNNSFQMVSSKYKEDNDSPSLTNSRKRSFQSQSIKNDRSKEGSKNDLSSTIIEKSEEELKKMHDFGSINVEMKIGDSLMGRKSLKSQDKNQSEEEAEGSNFRLVPKRVDNERSDNTDNLSNKFSQRENQPDAEANLVSGNETRNSLKKKVCLNVELESLDITAIPESPELQSGSRSPTKGAPRFFKSILEKGFSPLLSSRQIQSPSKKLEINWSKGLKKIGKTFLQSKINKDSGQKIMKETEDLPVAHDTDFDLLEDIERLTATDPGEYFKQNPTLLSKVNFVTISDFDYVKTLGAGAYGQVYLVRKKATGDYFAMKVIGSDKELSSKYIKNLLNEREVFSVIKSEFCVNAVATFTYQSLVCFVMEYLPGGDLYEEVFEKENLWFDSTSLRYYLAEMVLGIEALHENGIIHRDIKPANVLIDEKGHLKLTDFGLSEFRAKIGAPRTDGKVHIKGSAQYLAPEIVNGDTIGYEVDWWALGVMAYLFINMEYPFGGETFQEVVDNIIKGEIDWSNVGDNEEECEMSPALADLVKKLLDPNPLTRLGHNGSQEIKEHPYFKTLYWDKAKEGKLYMYPPEDILDLSPYEGQGMDMKEYINIAFEKILEAQETKTKTKANLPFSNRFELVRMDQFHRKNVKVRKEIKKRAREWNKEEQQVINVIQDYCKREELYFYRNFNNF